MGIIKKTGGWLWGNKIKMTLLVVLIGGGFYYWQKKQTDADAKTASKLKTATIEKGGIEVLVSGSGQVEASSQVDLKPQIAGDGIDIISVKVENNQEVKEDEIIAILDNEDALKVVREANLSLRSSQIKEKQVYDASPSKTTKDTRIRQAQATETSQRRNSLADANDKLEDYYIRAPFDGIVTGLGVAAGDSVSRDEILASVITKEMIATISLNEIDAVKVKKGAVAKLTFSALDGVEIKGEVIKMDTIGSVSQGVVSYNAEISFDATEVPDLKPGMSVEAEVITASTEDILIAPVAAVQSSPRGDGDFVVVVEKGLTREDITNRLNSETIKTGKNKTNMPEGLKRIMVTTGVSDDISVEISGEISEGETVLTQTLASLRTVSTITKSKTENASKSLIPTMGGGGRKNK